MLIDIIVVLTDDKEDGSVRKPERGQEANVANAILVQFN